MEIWKSLKYSSFYEVSNLGNVRATERWVDTHSGLKKLHRPKSVALTDNGHGYKIFGTKVNGKKKNFYIHRVVAQLFIPNPNNLPEVNHLDGNKANNNVQNLEWSSTISNRKHAVDNDLVAHGTLIHGSKLNKMKVFEILRAHKADNNVNRSELGRIYGVGDSKISGIIKGSCWRRAWEEFHGRKYEPKKITTRSRINGRFAPVY